MQQSSTTSDLIQARPITEEVDEPQLKRPRFTPALSLPELESDNRSLNKKKSSKTVKNRRQDKADSKSNTGIIGASMLLSAVGMLNYMGNQEMPICT